jgi:fatty-acyl-CoA synthase
MREVADRMGCAGITIAYGQTEASPVITQTQCGEPLARRVATVGRVLPGVEVRIVDPATGDDLPIGAQGELRVRGHGVMLGYYNMPEETAKVMSQDGWLHTGDLAQCTETGHYRITGRIKDMIIRGGENIYPREIEEFLLTHPKVRAAQIVGLPDARYGERVSAWIVPADPSLEKDELLEFCRARIAHYKIPDHVEFVEEFPMTVTGKVQKFVLRQVGIDRLRLQSAAAIETA